VGTVVADQQPRIRGAGQVMRGLCFTNQYVDSFIHSLMLDYQMSGTFRDITPPEIENNFHNRGIQLNSGHRDISLGKPQYSMLDGYGGL